MRRLALLPLLSFLACAHSAPPVESYDPDHLNSRFAAPWMKAQAESALSFKVTCEYPEVPRSLADAMAALKIPAPLTLRNGGSGVAVATTVALTAAHVLDCGFEWEECPSLTAALFGNCPTVWVKGRVSEIRVESRYGWEGDASVLYAGSQWEEDVGAVRIPPVSRWARLSNHVPAIGEKVCFESAIPERSRRCGAVQWFYKGDMPPWGDGYGFFRYDALGKPGTSGSGLYDETGGLVGLQVGGARDRSYAIATGWWHWPQAVRHLAQ